MGVVLFYLHSLLYRYFLLPAILTVVFAVWYRMSLKKGKRRKFLDFLAGLSLLCTVACIYVYWCTTRGSNMFLDMFYFTYLPDSGFLTLILQSVYMLALFGVWTLLVRFVFAAGPNWTLHLTTILFFGIMLCMSCWTSWEMRPQYGESSGFCGIPLSHLSDSA